MVELQNKNKQTNKIGKQKVADVTDRRHQAQWHIQLRCRLSIREPTTVLYPRCLPHLLVLPSFHRYLGTMLNLNWVYRRWWGKPLCWPGHHRVRKRISTNNNTHTHTNKKDKNKTKKTFQQGNKTIFLFSLFARVCCLCLGEPVRLLYFF